MNATPSSVFLLGIPVLYNSIFNFFIDSEFYSEVHNEVMSFGLSGIALRSSDGKAPGDAGLLCF
jgi:hypothetical protein